MIAVNVAGGGDARSPASSATAGTAYRSPWWVLVLPARSLRQCLLCRVFREIYVTELNSPSPGRTQTRRKSSNKSTRSPRPRLPAIHFLGSKSLFSVSARKAGRGGNPRPNNNSSLRAVTPLTGLQHISRNEQTSHIEVNTIRSNGEYL